MQKADTFIILFFELALDVLVLHKLQFFLFFLGRLMHTQVRHLGLLRKLSCGLNGSIRSDGQIHGAITMFALVNVIG